MRREYLLGATKDREIIFGEFEIRTPKYYTKDKGYYGDGLEFSASFNTVRPFKGDDIDLVQYLRVVIGVWIKNISIICVKHTIVPHKI